MARVLLIDDDELTCASLAHIVRRMGHEVCSSPSLGEGLASARSKDFDVIFLDVRMPDGNGLDALSEFQNKTQAPEVVVITGYGTPEGAERALRGGALEYLEKTATREKIAAALARALQRRGERSRNQSPTSLRLEGVRCTSAQMLTVYEQLAAAANTDVSVLITGETGTGKELIARAVHQNSAWANGPFVVVDCAAMPENLAESLLFGHEKGAYTGADRSRVGLIKQADRGTLFLDEVGELSPSLQKSFLRVLETQTFRPLGSQSQEESRSEFRMVAATNRNLGQMAAEGLLRSDLLFRLRTLEIPLPPLRNHPEDIRALATHHMNAICARQGRPPKEFVPEVFGMLEQYPWPGNIRELVHAMEMTYAVAWNDAFLQPWHLPMHIRIQAVRFSLHVANDPKPLDPDLPTREEILPTWREFKDKNERHYLERLLSCTDWDVRKASRISGLSRPRIYELIHKHRLSRVN